MDRAERALTDEEIVRIGDTYHAWRGSVPRERCRPTRMFRGFCKSVTLDDIRAAGYVLTPGRYVGAAAAEDDGEPVAEKIARLTKDLLAALDESARLDEVVREQVERAAVQVRLGDHLDFSNGSGSRPRGSKGRFPVYGANGAIGYATRAQRQSAR